MRGHRVPFWSLGAKSMKKVVSLIVISAFTAGLVAVAAPANARTCPDRNYRGNANYGISAYFNADSYNGTYRNNWWQCID